MFSARSKAMSRTATAEIYHAEIAKPHFLWAWTEAILVLLGHAVCSSSACFDWPRNKRILVAPKTSVKQTAAFPHGVFKWDMPLIPPNPQLSSWQPQQAWGWPSAEAQILLALLSCAAQRWAQPDAGHTHSPTHQQTPLTSAGSLSELHQPHLGVVGWFRQKNFYLHGPIASCPLLAGGGGVAPPSHPVAQPTPWDKDQ